MQKSATLALDVADYGVGMHHIIQPFNSVL